LIGDTHAAALVGRDGSIDWLCVPAFGSGACFAALLGDPRHGRWLIAPATSIRASRRRYRPETLVLGNFPQAFSHVMLINTARNLARAHGPAEERKK